METFLSGTYQNEFLLIFLLTLYFPMTYIAYYRKIDQRRVNLINKNAGRLLGYDQKDMIGYDQKDISDLTANTHSPFTYILFISLTVLLCIIGFSLFFWPPSQGVTTDASLPGILLSSLGLSININTLQAMRYGFLGAYIFSAFLLYRRYATNDLDPTAYLYCAFTLLTGMAFNYVAFEALSSVATTAKTTQVADGVGAGLIAILAFSMGYFPYLAIRWFNRQAYAVLRVGERRADSKPLSIIDGISDWHETRLRDNGIDDVQNLASAEIVDLLVNTSFPAEQIVAWIDQAILYQYLDDGEIDSFRRGKVAMFTDLLNHMDTSDGKIIDTEPLKELATALQSTPEKLKSLWISIQNGPNTHRIRHYWQEANNLADEARETPPIVRSAEAERASSYVALATQPIPSTEPDSTGTESGTVVTRLPTLPDDYYFLNHTSFLRPEKQAEFRKLTHVERDHYDIRVIVDSYYPSAMENIVQVEYILHNSFPNPATRSPIPAG